MSLLAAFRAQTASKLDGYTRRHVYAMGDAFGLDRKIDNYAGTRAITLFRSDPECLMDVIEVALKDPSEYPINTL